MDNGSSSCEGGKEVRAVEVEVIEEEEVVVKKEELRISRCQVKRELDVRARRSRVGTRPAPLQSLSGLARDTRGRSRDIT